jgi:hypothetical protein
MGSLTNYAVDLCMGVIYLDLWIVEMEDVKTVIIGIVLGRPGMWRSRNHMHVHTRIYIRGIIYHA